MQSLVTFLLQLSSKTWTVVIVAILGGGAAAVFHFSPAKAGSNPTPDHPTVVVQAGPACSPGGTLDLKRGTVPLPVVPEANAGLVLIPVVAAMLAFSSRRLWSAKLAAADLRVGGPDAV
jgi:hypothetical protein